MGLNVGTLEPLVLVEGRGRLGLFALVGWMSVLCQGGIQSQQGVLSVPTEIIELKLQQHNRDVPGGEKRMGEGIFVFLVPLKQLLHQSTGKL